MLFLRNVERSGYEADVEDEGEEEEGQESPEQFSYPDLMDLDDGWLEDGGQDIDLTVERLPDSSSNHTVYRKFSICFLFYFHFCFHLLF